MHVKPRIVYKSYSTASFPSVQTDSNKGATPPSKQTHINNSDHNNLPPIHQLGHQSSRRVLTHLSMAVGKVPPVNVAVTIKTVNVSSKTTDAGKTSVKTQ